MFLSLSCAPFKCHRTQIAADNRLDATCVRAKKRPYNRCARCSRFEKKALITAICCCCSSSVLFFLLIIIYLPVFISLMLNQQLRKATKIISHFFIVPYLNLFASLFYSFSSLPSSFCCTDTHTRAYSNYKLIADIVHRTLAPLRSVSFFFI